MITITGATGHLGGLVLWDLLENGADVGSLSVAVRDPEKARHFADKGIQVRYADYDKPQSLNDAFAGTERLLFVSSSCRDDGRRIAQHTSVIDAAVKKGVKHIFYTSFIDAHAPSPFPGAQVHQATEGLIRESGCSWTMLRNGAYADFLMMTARTMIDSGKLVTSNRCGHVSYVTRADLARATSAVIRQPSGHNGKIYPLTGPESLSQADLAAVFSNVTGKKIEYVLVSEEAYVEHMARVMKLPKPAAGGFLGMNHAIEEGRMSYISDDIELLTGRVPLTVEEYLKSTPLGS